MVDKYKIIFLMKPSRLFFRTFWRTLEQARIFNAVSSFSKFWSTKVLSK